MNTYRSSYLLIIVIILATFGLSCSKEKDEITEMEYYDSNIINKWDLVDISQSNKVQFISYDSIKCISDTPFVFLDGIKSEYVSETIQPNSLTDFQSLNDRWTIYAEDSLLIERDGYEPSGPMCSNGEITWMISPGFPSFNFKMGWKATSGTFTIFKENIDTIIFEIDYVDEDSLVLEMTNNKLIFKKQEN